jgi:6-phosphofructokinase
MSKCSAERAAVSRAQEALDRANEKLDRANRKLVEAEETYAEAAGAAAMCVLLADQPKAYAVCVRQAEVQMKVADEIADERHDHVKEAAEQVDAAQAALDSAQAALLDCEDAAPKTGCGSRGGPGYRRPDGKCAGWNDWGGPDDDD